MKCPTWLFLSIDHESPALGVAKDKVSVDGDCETTAITGVPGGQISLSLISKAFTLGFSPSANEAVVKPLGFFGPLLKGCESRLSKGVLR